ncbi:trophoblast glycoprotein-like [Bacillus rossius redtenbacheri]|uniref:trophoblast glycoprotein-like n=1 Tax=Bacillus rossius redtenbacheri TaxID=93214 RepID=UPI002FDD3278
MRAAVAVLVILVVAAVQGRPSRSSQPCQDLPACSCSGPGLVVMSCEGARLTRVPVGAGSRDVGYLALSGSSLGALPSLAFAAYPQLRVAYLSDAGVRAVSKDAFGSAPTLEEVDLSFNPLEELDPESFAGNPLLRSLVLMGDELARLPDGPLLVSDSLEKLDLSYCGIAELSPQAFARLPRLRHLDLAANRLAALAAGAVLGPLPLLEELVLEGNKWRCGCGLHELLGWTETSRGRPARYRPAACSGAGGDEQLWYLEEQGRRCPSEVTRSPGQVTTHANAKPDQVPVAPPEKQTEHWPISGIKIFNMKKQEEYPQDDRDLENPKEEDETEAEDGSAINSSKPEKIYVEDKRVQQSIAARAEKQSRVTPETDAFFPQETNYDGQEGNEDGTGPTALLSPTTFEIIFIVVLVCICIAIVVLTGLLMMYAFSAGRNVYRLMRTNSQDSSHYYN